jgi:hypothetical protein
MSHWTLDTRSAARLRDRNVRLLRRIGAGVVSLGVFGSLGLAGVLASSQPQGRTAAGSTGVTTQGTSRTSFDQWLRQLRQDASSQRSGASPAQRSDDGGEGLDDDGGGFVVPLPQLGTGQPPTLQPGSGSAPHATTQGS